MHCLVEQQTYVMGTRTVRLDDDSEELLARLRRLTGMSTSELLRQGLTAYERVVRGERPARPYDIYTRLDLGRGGWAVAPAREAKRAVRAVLTARRR